MLNFEGIDSIKETLDIDSNEVTLYFSDEIGDEALNIRMTKNDAWDMAKYIINKYNMNSKLK